MRITAYCGEAKVIVYPPVFDSAKPKLVFKGRLTWKVADTLHWNAESEIYGLEQRNEENEDMLNFNGTKIRSTRTTTTHSLALFQSFRVVFTKPSYLSRISGSLGETHAYGINIRISTPSNNTSMNHDKCYV